MKYVNYIFIILLFTYANQVMCCFCNTSSTDEANWEFMDEVIIGKVLSIERKELTFYPLGSEPFMTIGFETALE